MTRHPLAAIWIVFALVALAVAPQPAQGALLSKRFEFKSDVILEVGEATDDGIRLDSMEFRMPNAIKGKLLRTAGQLSVDVAISNTDQAPRRVGIAVALFDDQGRLLGVASGGNKLAAIKPGRQKRFELMFDGVNVEAAQSSVFQVSLESKP